MFGCILKTQISTSFSHFLNHFLIFQTNFIMENFNIYSNKKKSISSIHSQAKLSQTKREGGRKIEGKRDRSRKRDQSSAAAIRSILGGSRMRSVLGGDEENEMQDSDLDGGNVEEEERKKKKLGWRVIWTVGRHDLGGGVARSGLVGAWLR